MQTDKTACELLKEAQDLIDRAVLNVAAVVFRECRANDHYYQSELDYLFDELGKLRALSYEIRMATKAPWN